MLSLYYKMRSGKELFKSAKGPVYHKDPLSLTSSNVQKHLNRGHILVPSFSTQNINQRSKTLEKL